MLSIRNRHREPRTQRRRRRRLSALISIVAAAMVVVVPSNAAAAAPVIDPPLLDLDAHPVLNWSVPDRWTASWQAWNSTTGYNENVINPTSWSMTLDGCTSTSTYRVTGYTFVLTQVGTAWSRTVTTADCRLPLATLPARGAYSAKLTMHTDVG